MKLTGIINMFLPFSAFVLDNSYIVLENSILVSIRVSHKNPELFADLVTSDLKNISKNGAPEKS